MSTRQAEQIDTSNDQRTLISVIIVAAMVVTGIGFMAWMRRLLLNLKPLGGWSRWTPGWAIGGWFVPILNLIRPKQVMDDIWRGSDPDDPDAGVQPKSAKVDPLLRWWWAFWLAGGIGGTAASYYIGGEIESILLLGGYTFCSKRGQLHTIARVFRDGATLYLTVNSRRVGIARDTLWVDGECYGKVSRDDGIYVSIDGLVLVNDEVRRPMADWSACG